MKHIKYIVLLFLVWLACDPGFVWDNPYDTDGNNYPTASITPDEVKLNRFQTTKTGTVLIKNDGTGLLTFTTEFPQWISVVPQAGTLTSEQFIELTVKLAIEDPPLSGTMTVLTNSRDVAQSAKAITITVEAY